MSRVLGLDIGDRVVRGAFVRTGFKKCEVTRYVEAPIGDATDPQGRAEELRFAIRSVLGVEPRPPDQVISSLEGDEASVRAVQMPAGAAKRLAEVLPFELESTIPFDLEEALIDHQPIEQVGPTLHLLAAAARRAQIRARLEELQDAGVDPRELAVGAAALDGLTTVMPELTNPGPFVLIDIRGDTTDVCVLRNGRCVLARTVSAGMDDVRQGRLGALEASLRRTLAAYRSGGGPAPVKGLLGGDANEQPEAAAWLSGVLGCPMEPAPLPIVEGVDPGVGPFFMRALALAARTAKKDKRLDLRRGEFAPVRAMGAVRQHARLLVSCSLMVFFAFAFSIFARWWVLDEERTALEEQLAQTTESYFGVSTSDAQRARDLLTGGRARQSDPLPRFDAFDALDQLSSSVPPDVAHDVRRLTIDVGDETGNGDFELQGTLNNQESFENITEQLRGLECFQEVEPGRTTPAANDRLNYQIEAVIRCPGQEAPTKTKRGGSRGNR